MGKSACLRADTHRQRGCAASYSEAIARLISLALRSGIEPKTIIKQLSGIACNQISWYKGEKIHSCADAIIIL